MEAVRTLAEILGVNPDLAELIDAVEFDAEQTVFRTFRQAEALAVPADGRGKICTAELEGLMFAKWSFDASIVRKASFFQPVSENSGIYPPGKSPLENFQPKSKDSRILGAEVSGGWWPDPEMWQRKKLTRGRQRSLP